MWKKLLSVLCAAALLVALAAPAATAAAEPELLWAQAQFVEGETIDPTVQKPACAKGKVYGSSPFVSAQTYVFYGGLNDLEKRVYNAFKDAEIGTASITLTNLTWEAVDVHRLMLAISRDMPEIFYFNNFGYKGTGPNGSFSYYDTNGSGAFDAGDTVPSLIFYTELDTSAYADAAAIRSYNERLWAKIRSFDVGSFRTRYELIKGIHNFLADTALYDPNLGTAAENPRAHDAVGCLVDGVCVCQGYSEAFQVMCNYLKIPAVCITGTANGGGHMWNGVLMDDGNWYALDVTWDDQEQSEPFSDFFLIGLKAKDRYFGQTVFEQGHVADSDNLDVPLSDTSYVLNTANPDTRFAATYNSAEIPDSHCLKRLVTEVDEPVYYNGLWLSDCTAAATGDSFTAPSGAGHTAETWSLCLVGDVNGDGACTEEDFSAVVNKALAGEEIAGTADLAADINADGVLDALDARLALRFYKDVAAGRDVTYAVTAD